MAKLEHIRKMVAAMLDADLDARKHAGLLTVEQEREYRAMYKYYVPLRGFAERDDGGQIGKLGQGFDIRGKEVKEALGRMSIAENPLVQAIAMRQEGITRVEKNLATKTLLKQVQTYPNADLWEIIGELPTRKILDPDSGTVKSIVDYGALLEDEVVGVKIAGKARYIRLKDPLMAEAVKNMGTKGTFRT